MGGGGVLLGDPKTSQRGENVAPVRANVARFST